MASLNFRAALQRSQALLLLLTSIIDIAKSFSASASVSCLDNAVHSSSSSPQNQLIFPIKPSPAHDHDNKSSDGTVRTEIDIGNSLSSAFDTLVGSSDFMRSSSASPLVIAGSSIVFVSYARIWYFRHGDICTSSYFHLRWESNGVHPLCI